VAKSELVPVGAIEDVGGLASILGCRVFSLPVSTCVFCWELRIRQDQYEMALLIRWNIVWRIGRGFIYLREVESL
jgi:hypothetical protein